MSTHCLSQWFLHQLWTLWIPDSTEIGAPYTFAKSLEWFSNTGYNQCRLHPKVQFSWVAWPIGSLGDGGGGGGTWQQRSSCSLFCKRPLWAVLAWAGMSSLWCVHPAIFSADRGVAHPCHAMQSKMVLLFYFLKKNTFYNCIVQMGFLPWEIWVAFPGESHLQQRHATRPTVHAGCFSVSIIHQTLTWTTGSLTCT